MTGLCSVAALDLPYEQLVARAHVVDGLSRIDRDRVLARIVARYPEAVATVLSDMGAPEDLPGPVVHPPAPGRGVQGWEPALDLVDEPA